MLSLEQIISTLEQNRTRLHAVYGVQRIGVFGSYARGNQTADSDIDFVVDFSDNLTDLFETKYQLREFLSAIFHKQIDLANLKAIKPYVYKEISQEIRYA
jgi:predicted nucleotidyltransferase